MSQTIQLLLGDCLVRLQGLDDGSVGAVVGDPPYELGFMGKSWDSTGIAYDPVLWGHVYRILIPGGVVKAFCGTRTYHRMAASIEGVGFQDVSLESWAYGSGFPKSLNVSKALDKLAGAEREKKRVEYSGNALLRSGGQNTRPWMEEALKKGYHELPGDEPATEAAKVWDGWGTALKPAWEPIIIGRKP